MPAPNRARATVLASLAAVAAVTVAAAPAAAVPAVPAAAPAVAPAAVAVPAAVAAPAAQAVRIGSLSVSQTQNLKRDGQAVTVHGSGFDESKGIYISFCRDNGPGVRPTPCFGDYMTGESSVWVSSNPPPYGVGLARPYQAGGSFTITLNVRAVNTNPSSGAVTDCSVVACVVATTLDHTQNMGDPAYINRVRLTFAAPPAPATSSGSGGSGGSPGRTTSAPATTAAATAEPTATAVEEPAPTTTALVTTSSEPVALPVTSDQGGGRSVALWWSGAGVLALLLAGLGALVVSRRRAARVAPAGDPGAAAQPGRDAEGTA
jgi:hypothetical protein